MKRLLLLASALLGAGVITTLLFLALGDPATPSAGTTARSAAGDPAAAPEQAAAPAQVAATRDVAIAQDFAPMPLELRAPPDAGPRVASEAAPPPAGAAVALPRIVTSPGISPGPSSITVLEREAPPQPAAAVAVAAPAPPPGPDWQTFTQVVVVGAARIDLGGRKVKLADVVVPGSGSHCRMAGESGIFDCAALSMQALRQRIRGRGIECIAGTEPHVEDEPAHCRIGQSDLGLWLIQQGWGSAGGEADAGYAAAEHEALCAGRGIWAETAPPADCPRQ